MADDPAGYLSTLPIKAIVAALRAAGIPASVSQTGGTFTCNRVMYGLLHRLHTQGNRATVLYLPEQAAQYPGVPSMSRDKVMQALEIAIRVSLQTEKDLKVAGGATYQEDQLPEGPEIRRAADQLEEAVVGKPLTDVWFAFPELKTYEPALVADRAILLYSASNIELLNAESLAAHSSLNRVGPDVFDAQLDVATVRERAAVAAFSPSSVQRAATRSGVPGGAGQLSARGNPLAGRPAGVASRA